MKIKTLAFSIFFLFLNHLCDAQEGNFSTLSFTNLIKGNGPTDYSGWGQGGNGEFDLRTNSFNGSAFYMNHHYGMSFSAHSFYGGIRFYNQSNSGNPYSEASGAKMAMSINNGNVGIGTTIPRTALDVFGKSTIRNLLNTNDYKYVAQHNGQLRIENGWGPYGSRALEIALLENGTGVIQANESGVGYNTLSLNPAGGYIGIGTTTPLSALDVAGLIQISGINSDTPPPGLSYGLFGYAGVGLGIFSGATGPNQGMGFWTNLDNIKKEAVRISSTGDVGIGTTDPKGYRLAVNGKIRAQEIKVEASPWPDYVFAKSYQLPSLQETEEHIKTKGHLPGIPSAEEVKTNGIDLGEMNAKLLQKIEELTLHLIEKDKEIKALVKDVETLKKGKSNI